MVYLRAVYTDATTSTTLIMSKTKVAPLKSITIPRLELCSAHLLSKLLVHVIEALDVPLLSQVFAWTDSSIVLGWLNSDPGELKMFVANRVAETVDRSPPQQWRHVPTTDNPADISSRGMLPAELLQKSLWWHGPEWLLLSPNHWPTRSFSKKDLLAHNIAAHRML